MTEAGVAGEKHGLKDRAKEEMRRFLVMFLYLWLMFSLFQIHKYLILAEDQIPYEKFGVGFFNALVFGKVMVVADKVKFHAYMRNKPLITPILTRAFGFAALFLIIDVLEALILGAFHHKPLHESLPSHGGGGFLASALIGVIMGFALIPFFAFEEIDRELGRGRLTALLLHARKARAEG